MLSSSDAIAAPAIAKDRTVDPRLPASLAVVYLIWSSTYFAISVVVAELPPLLAAGCRFLPAGSILLVVALRRGATLPSLRDWLAVLPSAALLFIGGNGFVSIAERTVSSGGAAVVCATMPLWVGVLGFVTGERPTNREWMSLLLGFVGVVILVGGPTIDGDPLHIALIIASPICWALGSVLTRRVPASVRKDTALLSGVQMLSGGILFVVIGGAIGERMPLDASANAWLALAYLTVFGSVIGFTAYNWLLRNARPTVATSYAYVNPILAVLLGAALAGEPLGISTVVANVLIVGAILLGLLRPKQKVAV